MGSVVLIASLIIAIFTVFYETRIFGARWNTAIFSILFFCCAPLFERTYGILYYGAEGHSDESWTIGALLVFFFTIGNLVSVIYFRSTPTWKIKGLRIARVNIESQIAGLVLIFFLGISYLVLNKWNLFALVYREPEANYTISQIEYLFADRFLRLGIGLFSFQLLFFSSRLLIKIPALLLVIVFCFPTAIPRMSVAIIYVPLILIAANHVFSRRRTALRLAISSSCILAIPALFAILDFFRNVTRLSSFEPDRVASNLMAAGHLDAFQSFQNTYDHVSISLGQQLIGALLFFVPRSIWSDKPVGSSSVMADHADLTWQNVSMSIFSEGYINFGMVGAIGFPLIFLIFATLADRPRSLMSIQKVVFHYGFPGCIFVLLRGDLMTALSFVFSIILISNIMRLKIRVLNYSSR